MADLFPAAENAVTPAGAPLAEQLRPRTLAEVVGQDHLTGPDGAITRMVAAGSLAAGRGSSSASSLTPLLLTGRDSGGVLPKPLERSTTWGDSPRG